MDTFAFHPYGEKSVTAPTFTASELEEHRPRRLHEAGLHAQGRVQGDAAARGQPADRLRRVRRPDDDSEQKAVDLHEPRDEDREGRSQRGSAGQVLPPGAHDGVLPAERRRAALLPRHRRVQRQHVAVGRLLRRRHAEDEPRGRARRRRCRARRDALELRGRLGERVPPDADVATAGAVTRPTTTPGRARSRAAGSAPTSRASRTRTPARPS